MIELWTTTHSLEKYKSGEETFAYNSLDWLKGNNHPAIKILVPFEAVEHLGNGEFRLQIKGLKY